MTKISEYIEISKMVYEVDILDRNRSNKYKWGRAAVYVALRYEGMSYQSIADAFNNNHATIIHAINQHRNLYKSDKLYTSLFESFKNQTSYNNKDEREILVNFINELPFNAVHFENILSYIKNRYYWKSDLD